VHSRRRGVNCARNSACAVLFIPLDGKKHCLGKAEIMSTACALPVEATAKNTARRERFRATRSQAAHSNSEFSAADSPETIRRGRERAAKSKKSKQASKALGSPALQPGGEERVAVGRALKGDSEALGGLFTRYRTRLYRIALRLLRSKEDAEDVVQDALLLAYRNLSSFEGRSMFSTWLTRIVVNCALGRRRRQRTHPEKSYDDVVPGDAPAWPAAIVDSRPDPEQAMAWSETQVLVQDALDELAPAMRSAFKLRELQDLPNADAAQVAGVRENTFKSRMSRARQHLADHLDFSLVAPLRKPIPLAVASRAAAAAARS